MFIRLIITDFKRIRYLLLPLFLCTAVLGASFAALAAFTEKVIYQDASPKPVRVGVVMSIDSEYGKLAYHFVTEMESYQNTCEFVTLESEEAGREMLQKEQLQAVIVVPDNILSDIIDGTNTPVTVLYREDGSLETYAANEVFVSTSSMLGTSQAAIYTALKLGRNLELSPDLQDRVNTEVNTLFFNYVLTRTALFDKTEVHATGLYPVRDFYIAAGFLLLLSMLGILFLSLLKNNAAAYIKKLKLSGISAVQAGISQWLTITATLYGIYLLLYTVAVIVSSAVSTHFLSFHTMALPAGLPVCACIALITVLIGKIPVSQAAASMILLIVVFLLAYTGGCLVPEALLPAFLKPVCTYSPYYHMIQLLCNSMF